MAPTSPAAKSKPPAPVLQASEAALNMSCSISMELSRLLSAARGQGLQAAVTRKKEVELEARSRIVSYIPAGRKYNAAAVLDEKVRALLGKTASASASASAPSLLGGKQLPLLAEHKLNLEADYGLGGNPSNAPAPELDFDPAKVTEYVSAATHDRMGRMVESGAVWIGGKGTARCDIAWSPKAAGTLKADRRSASKGSAFDVGVRAVDFGDKAAASARDGAVTEREPTPAAASAGARRKTSTPEAHRAGMLPEPSPSAPTARQARPSTAPSAGPRAGPAPSPSFSAPALDRTLLLGASSLTVPPRVTQVTGLNWGATNPDSKRRLLRGALPRQGEVSNLIQEVRKRSSPLSLKKVRPGGP